MAAEQVDADGVLWSELDSQGVSRLTELSSATLVGLALRYAIWLPVDTYIQAPWIAPFAIRRLRVRTDPRAPGPKRDLWGLPDERGLFTDDNSLIKGVVSGLAASEGSPYGSSPIQRGLVCCHVWPGTTTDPLLFSFVPNLVWLPRSLAAYSDAHMSGPPHRVHEVLKDVSVGRYRSHRPNVGRARSEAAWRLLPAPSDGTNARCSEFLAKGRIAALAQRRTREMVAFLEATLTEAQMPNRFSKRYHAGVGPGIDPSVWPVQRAVSAESRLRLIVDLKASMASPDAEASASWVHPVQRSVAPPDAYPEQPVRRAEDVAPAGTDLSISEAELDEFGDWLVRTRSLKATVSDYKSRVRRVAAGVDMSPLTPGAQASLRTAIRAFEEFRRQRS